MEPSFASEPPIPDKPETVCEDACDEIVDVEGDTHLICPHIPVPEIPVTDSSADNSSVASESSEVQSASTVEQNVIEVSVEVTPVPTSPPSVWSFRRANLVQVDPPSFLTVPLEVLGHQVEGLLDTGSRISLVTYDTARRLGVYVDASKISHIYGVGGKETRFSTLGVALLPVAICQIVFPACLFHVVPDGLIDHPMFLGVDFLSANRLEVDVHRRRIGGKDNQSGGQWDLYLGGPKPQIVFTRIPCTTAEELPSVKRETGECVVPDIRCKYPCMFGSTVGPCLDPNKLADRHQILLFSDKNDCYLYDGEIPSHLKKHFNAMSGIFSLDNPRVVLSARCCHRVGVPSNVDIGIMSTVVVIDPPLCQSAEISLPADQSEDRARTTAGHDADSDQLMPDLKLELGNDLSSTEQSKIYQMLSRCRSVLSSGDEDMGHINMGAFKIQLYHDTPIYQRPRRFPEPVAEEIERQCSELLAHDIIEPSNSPFNCRILPIRKPDGTLRLCMDYRMLNAQTIPDRFPMPNLADAVYSLHGVKYFTTLDLVRGYYQLPVEPESRPYTAFSTSRGHWQYKRMPFGLCNAPAAFQRVMQDILKDFPRSKVIVYLDDILILETDFERHLALVERVLKTLLQHGIKIKPRKCSWFKEQVEFLGHLVSRTGVTKHPKYIEKVQSYPKPTTVKQLREFMGLVNWQRKFVPHCAEIGKPLYVYTGGKGNAKLSWTPEMDRAYQELKEALAMDVKLAFPDYSSSAEPLELFVDASATGAGACLCQKQSGERRVIAHASMAFTETQMRYSTIERELVAIRWGTKAFRAFLYGQHFVLHTDHQPLVYLHNMKLVDNRLARTLEDLGEFDFTIVYTPGSQNQAADALSRFRFVPPEHSPDSDSENKLPVGLKVSEIPGGGDSMFVALHHACQELLAEDVILPVVIPDSPQGLREELVEVLLHDPAKYGLPADGKFKRQLRAMRQPGHIPVPDLLLVFADRYNITVYLYFGGGQPAIFKGSDQSEHHIHLQCLAGVHYNPVTELRKFNVNALNPSECYSPSTPDFNSVLVRNVGVQDVVCDMDDDDEIPVKWTACDHSFCGAVVQASVEDQDCCALLDSGASVNLICESLFRKLNNTDLDKTVVGSVQGVGSATAAVLGATYQDVKLGSGKPQSVYFLVVSDDRLASCMILGTPFLTSTSINLNFDNMTACQEGEVLSVMGCGNMHPLSQCKNDVVMAIWETDHALVSSFVSPDSIISDQQNNPVVRGLKRLKLAGVTGNELPRRYKTFKRHWPFLQIESDLLMKEINGRLVPVISSSYILDVVLNLHAQMAHIGAFKLYQLISRHMWHPSLRSMTRDACVTCSICQKNKPTSQLKIPPTIKIETSAPFELMAIDLVSLPPTQGGFIGLLVLVDHYSKWLAVAPIKNKRSAHIVHKLEHDLFPHLLKLPTRLLSDNGPEFTSLEFSDMVDRLNIHHVKTTAYKPSSNGAVERVNRTIIQFLRDLSAHPSAWVSRLPMAVRVYNETVHKETNMSPAAFLMTREHPVVDHPLVSPETRKLWDEGHPQFMTYHVGRKVLKRINYSGRLNVYKMTPKYAGPYEIVTVHNNGVTYIVRDNISGEEMKAHHVQLKSWHEPPAYIIEHLKRFPLKFRKPDDDELDHGTTPDVIPAYDPLPIPVEVTPVRDFPSAPVGDILSDNDGHHYRSLVHSLLLGMLSLDSDTNAPVPQDSPVNPVPSSEESARPVPPVETFLEEEPVVPILFDRTSLPTIPEEDEGSEISDSSSSEGSSQLSSPVVSVPERQILLLSGVDSMSDHEVSVPPALVIPMETSVTGHFLTRDVLDWDMESISVASGEIESISERIPDAIDCAVCEQVAVLVESLDSLCTTGVLRLLDETPNARSFSGFSVLSRSHSSPSLFHETTDAQSFSGFSDISKSNSTPELSMPHAPIVPNPVLAMDALFSDLRESISEIREVINTNRRATRDRVQRVLSDSPRGASRSGASQQTASPVLRNNLSPPHLRSRGRTVDLPWVMRKPLEYSPHQN